MATVNPYRRLAALFPPEPLMLAQVKEVDIARNLSRVEFPEGAPVSPISPGLSIGSTAWVRGTSVAVNDWAWVRGGAIEAEAPSGDAVQVEVGGPKDGQLGVTSFSWNGPVPEVVFAVGVAVDAAILPYCAGGREPYALALTGGTLPPGVTLDGLSFKLTGIPTAAGTYGATFTATDALGATLPTGYVRLTTGVPPPAGNPNWAYLEALLPFDVDLADHGPLSRSVTVNGSVTVSSAQSRFGVASASFPGTTSDYLSVGTAGQFDFLTRTLESWTIRGWYRVPNTLAVRSLVVKGTNNSTMAALIFIINGTNLAASMYKSSGYGSGGSAVAAGVVANTWQHFALTYDAGTRVLRAFVDGVLGATADTLVAETNFATPNGQVLTVGRYSDATFPFDGFLQGIEIMRGACLHTANFTPQNFMPTDFPP
jgi:hypothetical protein